ncbi:MAG TPA: hypothetical protein VIX15_14585 [Streptosporangiaceae bacterium]
MPLPVLPLPVLPLPVLPLPAGAPGAPCPPFMFLQLWVGFAVDDAEGVAVVVLAEPALAAVVPDVEDEVVDDVVVAECVVAALATAMPPSPTPSAPAPTAVPIMILPSLVFNVSAS